eukprot:SAG22_NODE_1168_length_5271_cov_13.249613_1_plen_280_part_00
MLPRRLMMVEWLDALAIDFFTPDSTLSFLGIHCVVEMDLFSEFAITVTVPVIGLLVDDNEQHALAARLTRDWAAWLAIGWLFLVYTILCRTTFQSFACHELDSGESFHRSDYTIDCESSEYKAYSAAAYVFIAIYPVGIPTAMGLLLYYNRNVLGDHAGSSNNMAKWWFGDRETLHFLVDGYRSQTYWYELVDFLRKLLMAGVVVFVDRGSAAQFFIAIFVSCTLSALTPERSALGCMPPGPRPRPGAARWPSVPAPPAGPSQARPGAGRRRPPPGPPA